MSYAILGYNSESLMGGRKKEKINFLFFLVVRACVCSYMRVWACVSVHVGVSVLVRVCVCVCASLFSLSL